MRDKINRLLRGGAKPKLTFAERALLMSRAHATFMEHANQLERDIADKKQDISDAHARISALQQLKV